MPVIHVDTQRASIGRWLDADVAIVGDAGQVAAQLLQAVPERAEGAPPYHAPEVLADIAGYDLRHDFEPQGLVEAVGDLHRVADVVHEVSAGGDGPLAQLLDLVLAGDAVAASLASGSS